MDNVSNDEWACCSIKNKSEIKYFTQVFFGLLIMCFSMYQIIKNGTGKGQEVYISLLSSTLGYFLPSPSMNR